MACPTQISIWMVQYGSAGVVPVAGDCDGDGDVDRVVYRPGTGQWFVHGIAGLVQYGQSGDIPLPSPYAVRRVYFAV